MYINKKIFLFIFLVFLSPSITLSEDFRFKKISSLSKPWGSSFINDNELIITEKTGKIKVVNINNGKVIEVKHNLKFKNIGQGGLLDIIYKNNYVWVSYTELIKPYNYSTSIARGEFNRQKIRFENIFQQNSASGSTQHFGSRLEIQGNYLFASIGERGGGMIAQNSKLHAGSIIRIHLDGSMPKDNPKFVDKPYWLKEIFQIGLRNPQGLTLSPFDKKIYISNHGARGGDWFGQIKKSGNYGWKILGWGGTNYDGTKIGPKWKIGFTKAIHYWVPSIGISAITIYKGKEFSKWNGEALITSLRDESLRKINFQNLSKVKEEIIFKNKINRIRDINIHPKTGKIFFLTEKKYSEDGPKEDSLWLMENNN